jgi:hypothetical protein
LLFLIEILNACNWCTKGVRKIAYTIYVDFTKFCGLCAYKNIASGSGDFNEFSKMLHIFISPLVFEPPKHFRGIESQEVSKFICSHSFKKSKVSLFFH